MEVGGNKGVHFPGLANHYLRLLCLMRDVF